MWHDDSGIFWRAKWIPPRLLIYASAKSLLKLQKGQREHLEMPTVSTPLIIKGMRGKTRPKASRLTGRDLKRSAPKGWQQKGERVLGWCCGNPGLRRSSHFNNLEAHLHGSKRGPASSCSPPNPREANLFLLSAWILWKGLELENSSSFPPKMEPKKHKPHIRNLRKGLICKN